MPYLIYGLVAKWAENHLIVIYAMYLIFILRLDIYCNYLLLVRLEDILQYARQ